MRANARTKQGGSIVSFIIVGTLLLAGLGGGIYYLSQRGGDSTQEQVAQAPESDSNSDNEGTGTFDIDDPDTAENNADQPEDKPAPQDEAPAEDEPREEAAPAAPTTPSSPSTPDRMATTGGPNSAQELPQTGPAEVILGAVALASVTFVAIIYRRSRQDLANKRSS